MQLNQNSRTLFLRTYAKDAEWLPYLERSLARNGPDEKIWAVTPTQDLAAVVSRVSDRIPVEAIVPVHVDGYIDQQWSKLHADQYTDTDYVIHLDSDCLLIRSLDDLFVDGKPIMMKTPYSMLCENANKWKATTARYVGFVPEYEYMRRQGLVYPRWIYAECRKIVEGVVGKPWDIFFPQIQGRELSEFNILGSLCDKYFHDEFHWMDTAVDPLPPLVIHQNWSWGGVEKARNELESLLSNDNIDIN